MTLFSHTTLILLLVASHVTATKSFYCDFGVCQPEQYCCEYNKCCDRLLDLWYLWVGLILVIVVIAVIILFKMFCKTKRTDFTYLLVPQTEKN